MKVSTNPEGRGRDKILQLLEEQLQGKAASVEGSFYRD